MIRASTFSVFPKGFSSFIAPGLPEKEKKRLIPPQKIHPGQTGYSINPDIPFEKVRANLEEFDFLLLMSVYPGFGGQKFIEDVIPKISEAREFIDKNGLKTLIQVDGGVDKSNAERVVKAGADWLVMGTAFFNSEDRAGLVDFVRKL